MNQHLIKSMIIVLLTTSFYKTFDFSESTIGSLFHKVVKKHPHKTAFINVEDGKKWTFIEFEKLVNQFGNYFLDQGLRKGDVVALSMTNRPEYVAIWMGLSKIGVITALLNTNLRSESLAYCIKIANAKNVIIGSDFQKGNFFNLYWLSIGLLLL